MHEQQLWQQFVGVALVVVEVVVVVDDDDVTVTSGANAGRIRALQNHDDSTGVYLTSDGLHCPSDATSYCFAWQWHWG